MAYALNLILLFFGYSFIGWCIEVTLKYIQFHRLINRGFYTGPICPIYGSGAALITLSADLLPRAEASLGSTFALSFLLCGAVEYLTSYFMEKRFHARWWDYSTKPMNLHGRVWIGNLMLFGIGGAAIVHLLNPPLFRALGRVSLMGREIAAGAMIGLFALDFVGTHFVLKLVKTGAENSQADDTEEIRKEIKALLSDRAFFYRRFADAYPDVIFRTERVKKKLEQIREESERLRAQAERQLSERVQQAAAGLEPVTFIKSEIINKQDELIALLYREDAADERMRGLKREIEEDKARLLQRPFGQISGIHAKTAGGRKRHDETRP